jgi:hypothetical protein
MKYLPKGTYVKEKKKGKFLGMKITMKEKNLFINESGVS